MRWTQSAERISCADERRVAYGKTVWSWPPDAEVKLRETDRAMTGARKPGPRGERGISRKAIAQGRPDYPAEPVVTAACFFCCTRAMGISRYPAFPAPSDFLE